MVRNRLLAMLALPLMFSPLGANAQQAARQQHAGRYERITVHGASLVGNLDGDSADREVSIYLPPGYAKQTKRRYPVLYLLHGFTDSDGKWFGLEGAHFVNVPKAVDAAYAAGLKEMIVVMPNAFTKFEGSMYSSSVAIGDWETFITRELVLFVDTHYRTLAKRESRGLAGHSMGGYGVLRLGMKVPNVFSALYAMSPCCLAPNPQADPQMFARAATVRTAQDIAAADFMTKAMLASAAAWSPNPKNPPLYINLPVSDGQLQPEVVAEWTANAPLAMLHQYLPALKNYRGLAVDAGDEDRMIASTVQRLHELLDGYGLPHEFEIYPGDHVNRIEKRLTTKVLPFFDSRLMSR
jgi:enterochelin esterase-like enzyme